MDSLSLWLQLVLVTGAILVAARYLTKSADIIAEKTGLGRSFAGVVLLATATSLAELGTGVSSIVLLDEPDLAAGAVFGSNLVNLLIIAVADLYWRNGPILTAIGTASVLVGAGGIAIIGLATFAVFIHTTSSGFEGWLVSPITLIIGGMFLGSMWLIHIHKDITVLGEEPLEEEQLYGGYSLGRAAATFGVATLVVLGSSVWLASVGDQLADVMGWEKSFMGSQFLAFSTSLPEIATTWAAIKLNAPEMAITNLLGSNVFNMGLVLVVNDLVYVDGVLWRDVSQTHMLAGLMAIILTCVVIAAIVTRPRGRLGKVWTVDGVVITATYVAASVLFFNLA